MLTKIIKIEEITHNVRRYTLEKPVGYKFIPGQATDVSINKTGWEDEKHPFTFTCLNTNDYLEFTIKSYKLSQFPNHSGMTEILGTLEVGDELIIDEPWGTINYQGKGVFIAGGAGITPFIAILRDLKSKNELKGNRLIFSNKTQQDIIIKQELEEMFKVNPEDLTFVLTEEESSNYHFGRIDEKYLSEQINDFGANFYICGPRPMVRELTATLANLGCKTESIVFEK